MASMRLSPVGVAIMLALYHALVFPESRTKVVGWLGAIVGVACVVSVILSRGVSMRRKSAIAMWDNAQECQLHCDLEMDCTEALKYIERVREETGVRVTLMHLFLKCLARLYHNTPKSYMNGHLAFGHFFRSKTVDLGCLILQESTGGVSPYVIREANTKTVLEIAEEVNTAGKRVKKHKDKDFKRSMGLIRLIPPILLNPILKVVGILTCELGINSKPLGLKAFPFGCVQVTNIGMFERYCEDSTMKGITGTGMVPPLTMANIPMYVVMTRVFNRPWVVKDKVEVRPILKICVTVDHRLMDGLYGAEIVHYLSHGMEHPEILDDDDAGIPIQYEK